MVKSFSLFLLFTTVALTTTAPAAAPTLRRFSAADSSSPAPSQSISPPPLLQLPPPPVPQPSPSPSPPEDFQQQLQNIIDALIGAGDFAGWASILSNPNMNSSITSSTTATLFLPGSDALSHLSATATGALSFDPFIIPYHILPQRLSFSQLQFFKTLTRLPTLLPSKTILITNNSPSNFTIDNSLITHPDLYLNSAIAIHGIETLLDYTIYGVSPAPPPPPPAVDATPTPPPQPDNDRRSRSVTSASSGVDFLILSSLLGFCLATISL